MQDGGQGGSDGGERPSARELARPRSVEGREPDHGRQGWVWLGGGRRRRGVMTHREQRGEPGTSARPRGLSTLTHPTLASHVTKVPEPLPLRTSGRNRDTPSEQVAVGPGFRRGECSLLSALLSQTWSFVPLEANIIFWLFLILLECCYLA